MTIDENKAIVRAWVKAWVENAPVAVDDLFAEDYTVNGVVVGQQGVKQAMQLLHSALSDISMELKDLIAEGDKVTARWVVRGMHSGELMGMPATNRFVEFRGINIYQIMDGRIAANDEQTNVLEVTQGLKAGT